MAQLPKDAQPILQIVHVSDIHVDEVPDGRESEVDAVLLERQKYAWAENKLKEWLDRTVPSQTTRRLLLEWLYKELRCGTAPYDPGASDDFLDFLGSFLKQDERWIGMPTWLVDTGDHSVFGDTESLKEAAVVLKELCFDEDNLIHLIEEDKLVHCIHGNHDVWPMDFFFPRKEDFYLPWTRSVPEDVKAHLKQLEQELYYAVGKVVAPLRQQIAGGPSVVQLFTLDTVDPARRQNFFARGRVEKRNLDDLDDMINGVDGEGDARHFRILASHHPVTHPPSDIPYVMKLHRADRVQKRLRNAPRIHLVLSGHTHDLYPLLGTFHKDEHFLSEPRQLVVGTLMQVDYSKEKVYDNQFQILRLYESQSYPRQIYIERIVAARAKLETRATDGRKADGRPFENVSATDDAPGEVFSIEL